MFIKSLQVGDNFHLPLSGKNGIIFEQRKYSTSVRMEGEQLKQIISSETVIEKIEKNSVDIITSKKENTLSLKCQVAEYIKTENGGLTVEQIAEYIKTIRPNGNTPVHVVLSQIRKSYNLIKSEDKRYSIK